MVEGKLVLVKLAEHRTNIQVGVGLDFGPLQFGLNRQGLLQKVEGGAHFADAAVVASHIVEGHGLAEFVVLAEFLRLLQQIKRRVHVLLLQVVNGQNIANLAQLLAGAREFLRSRSKVHFLYFQKFLKDANCLYIFGLKQKRIKCW